MAQRMTVVIEKGGPYQHVNVGEVDRGIAVARRVRSYPEVPDRRGVARQQRNGDGGADGGTAGQRHGAGAEREHATVSTRINARSRRCAEPRIPDEPFLVGAAEFACGGRHA